MFKEFLSSFKPVSGDISKECFRASQLDVIPIDDPVNAAPARKTPNWRGEVVSALMSGASKKAIVERFAKDVSDKKKREIVAFVDKYYGLVGTVLVDCSRIERQSSYGKLPNKKYHCYAINCKCYEEKTIKTARKVSGGSIDNVLEQEESIDVQKVRVCRKTGLPVISSLQEVEQNKIDKVIDILIEEGTLGTGVAKEVRLSSNKLSSLKKVFVEKNATKSIKVNSPVVDGKYDVYGLNNAELNGDVSAPPPGLDFRCLNAPQTIDEELTFNNTPSVQAQIDSRDFTHVDLGDGVCSLDDFDVDAPRMNDCPVIGNDEVVVVITPVEEVIPVDVRDTRAVAAKIKNDKSMEIVVDKKAKEIAVDDKPDKNWI